MATSNSNLTYTIPINNTTTSQIYVIPGGNGGSGGVSYANTTTNSYTNFTNSQGKSVLEIPNTDTPSIKINGSIEWNGENLQDRLERIETLLHIPTRDVKLEEKYEKLRILFNQYKQALEEYKTWERLKNSK